MSRAAAAALAGLVLIVSALTFEAQPLFVPGVAFTIIGVLTPSWVRLAMRNASIERSLQTRRVVEDEPLEALLTVRCGLCGIPRAEILDPLADRPVSLGSRLSPLSRRRTVTVRLVGRFARRGRRQLARPSLVVRDVLDLVTATREGAGGQEVLVLPRTEAVRWTGAASGERLEQPHSRALLEPVAATKVDGLRPYRAGTPASRIHWPAVARGAGLLERRLLDDGDSRPLVVLDARCQGPAEELDAAVRAAASLALELARHSGCALLLPGRRRPIEIDRDLVAWPAAHSGLAVVEGGPAAPAPALGRRATLDDIFYVTAAPLRRLPPLLSANAGGVAAVVLPASLSAVMSRAPTFEVSGCQGFVLRPDRRLSATPARGRRVA